MTTKINGTNTAASPAITGADTDTGLSFGTDTVNINTGGSTRATVESNGRLGIGTASPSSLVHLNSSGDTQLILSSDSDTFKLSCFSNGEAGIETAGANPLRFFTSASERMRIDSSGRTMIGTTTAQSLNGVGAHNNLVVAGSTSDTNIVNNSGAAITISNTDGTANNTAGLHFAREDTDGSPHYAGASIVAQFNDTMNTGEYPRTGLFFLTSSSNNVAPSQKMHINDVGDIRIGRVYSNTTSGGANVRVQSDGLMQRDTSSRRYKNTIADATHGLTDLKKLRPVTYKGNNDGDTVFGGLIAEEVHDAGLTEFVDYDSDNKPDALKYGNMVSLCIKAIQELSAKVETLETKVAALEAG